MKLREYFVHKENKNNDFIQQFLLFCASLRRVFMSVPRRKLLFLFSLHTNSILVASKK